jgi:hypothetical protein
MWLDAGFAVALKVGLDPTWLNDTKVDCYECQR